jgi:hypothetical protein
MDKQLEKGNQNLSFVSAVPGSRSCKNSDARAKRSFHFDYNKYAIFLPSVAMTVQFITKLF